MSLLRGTRLGPYEVLGLIGTGGMGEVYRARDPRLGRDVAVKVLPAGVAGDPDRLRRFEQEARAVAALNHPNILTVYDVGTHEGGPYVVMELLEGETLRELVRRRTLTQRQVLGYAVQVAQGLDAAHQKGIVHRDLKPANLFVTTQGRVKVLDFGLAKLVERGALDTEAVTASSPTGTGQVLGTVAYMSPEQARAGLVDHRSDIFSFGLVLYELLSGKHPFLRETTVGTLTAIVEETPAELVSLSRGVPPALSGIVGRCLEKDREQRFRSAHDLALSLEAVLQSPTGAAFLQEVEERGPYPGLASFTEKDAAVFFGREQEVAALWERLRSRHLSGVIGPSGAGKTSFVRAGVVPARPEGWAALVCTPGAAPLRGLGRALVPELSGDPEALGRLVDVDDPAVAFDLVSHWRRGHGEALLVVDQFEELFTLNPEEGQGRFTGLLGRLAREADVRVLLSLRDDFLMRCADHEPIARVFESLSPLPALSTEGLRRALEEPAKARGYRFEDEALVGEMVEAVEGARAALPLLAFAVARLWESRDRERKLLTRAAYEEIGGVAGALAQHAEATMDRIGPERQGLVRELFRNLVTAQGTRAVIDREELLSAFPDRAGAEEVLRQLIDGRLLTTYEVEGKEGEAAHHRVEVVHESLLKAWPRLVRWQTQDEDGAQLRDQLKQAAHLWDEKGRTSDLLWTGTAYQEYELWRGRYPGALTAVEEDFARSMAEKARRRKRLVRGAAVGVVLVSTAVAIAIGVSRHQAVEQARRAEREARLAVASKLVALGRSELERYPAATLAYARKSLEVADNAEGRRLAVEALWRSPSLRVLPTSGGFMTFSPDGTRLAVASPTGAGLLYPDNGSPPTAIAGFAVGFWRPAFTPTGDALLGSAADGHSIRVVSVSDGREIRRFEARLPNGRAAVLADRQVTPQGILVGSTERVVPDAIVHWRLEPYGGGPGRWVGAWRGGEDWLFDDAGQRLAVVRGRSIHVRPVAGDERTPESEVTRVKAAKSVALAFSPGGGRLAVGDSETGRLALWRLDPPSSRPERVLTWPRPKGLGYWPTFDSTGTRIAWGSFAARAVWLGDLGAPPDAAPRVVRWPDASETGPAVFDPHVSWMAVAHLDQVNLWAIAQPWPRILGGLGDSVLGLRFTSDSRRLLSCEQRDGLSVWPLDPGVAPARARLPMPECWGMALTPDDRQVLWGAAEVHLTPIEAGTGADFAGYRSHGDLAGGTAIDASGRWGASVSEATDPSVRKKIRVWHLLTGRSLREWNQAPEGEPDDGYRWMANDVAFLGDGRLIVGQAGGVRLLDPRTGADEWAWKLPPTDAAMVAASGDGRHAAAFRVPDIVSGKLAGVGDIVLLDLASGNRRTIGSHGTSFASLALDATGSVLVTGGLDGAVRVGPSDGREPHLLCCHADRVDVVAVSPNGKWIASSGHGEIRLWPMPDLSKPPLHALPYDELMAKLRSLTNLQVVEDEASATGYKIGIGPFPGWKDVPSW